MRTLRWLQEGNKPGSFTPWQEPVPQIPACCFTKAYTVAVVKHAFNIAQYVDLLNWRSGRLFKSGMDSEDSRDNTHNRGYSQEAVVKPILNRMNELRS